MKILYCITGLGIGGAEVITVDIANKMLEQGNQVMIIYLTGENKQANRISKDIQLISLNMSVNPLDLVRAQWRARKIILEWKPDIIHGNMVHANVFFRLLRLHCRLPFLISTEHNKNIEGWFRMQMYRMTDFLSDINTNVSEEATSFFIQKKAFSIEKSMTIYNGIDLKRFSICREKGVLIRKQYNIPGRDFLFLNVGRLMPAKNQKNLITAFAKLVSIYPDISLLIVGEGNLRQELENYIKSLSLEQKIILVGNQYNIADYYNSANCFVLSSDWEGFGIVLAEAMACELPVITTNAGGCREVVNNPEFVIKPQCSEELYLKMKQLCEMPVEQRKEIGINNRRRAMRFDIDLIYRQWLDIYQNKHQKN